MNTNIDIKKNKAECLALLRSTQREGMEDMIIELEKMGYFTAPASSHYHLNVEGGLVQHSLNTYRAALTVWEGMKQFRPKLGGEVTKDNLIIACLLHDICKCDIYKKNTKQKRGLFNIREEVSTYSVSYEDFPMGHGEKSVILALAGGLEMYDSEMVAIRWHMGAWRLNQDDNEEKQCYKAAADKFPLVTILQTADTLAARIIE
jgi:hypothetical protein